MKLNASGTVLWFCLLLLGCDSAPSVPCPSDQTLIERFAAYEAEFEKLASAPESQATLSRLGIERVIRRSDKPLVVLYQVWFQDFFGPGGCTKGYAYCDERPTSVVDSIDRQSDPGSPEVKEIYRPIKGNWYLFYASDN